MNLVQRSVSQGGKLAPIAIDGTFGGMNPSIFIDDQGRILVNVRVVNYILYHSENEQQFPSRWGPLSYLHPEKDQRLVTENYLCELNNDLELIHTAKVEMMNLHEPIWEFVGLEDARLVQWEGDYYLVGVRRDTTTHGQGRMEYSKIEIDAENWSVKEIQRVRIPALDENSYCEKNWYPVIDKPYHFIKWTMPTEMMKADPNTPAVEQVILRETITPPTDQRGSSQLIPWGNMYICITHEVNLFKNYLDQKDGIYRHRLVLWDNNFNIVGMSNEFSFLDGRIEFCVGATKLGEDLLLSFGFQDNAAFVLKVPKLVVEDLILEALC